MSDRRIRRIVIVGGGTAGWMAAAPLSQRLPREGPLGCEIVLVESPEISTVGVGEATIPPIRWYNRSLGLEGAEFTKRTQGTFKLGIEFRNWGRVGHRFFHGFGDFGPPIENRSPYQHWLRLAAQDPDFPPYEDWSTSSVMARHMKFTPPQGDQPSAANAYSYAYQFDAWLYAGYLREYATARGVKRELGTIVDVELRPEDGFVAAVRLADGRRIEGDLFIDCSGFRGLLIEGAMKAGYEDWRSWLPCDRALAVSSERTAPLRPYTSSTAHAPGWQWTIPLQHRTGSGLVYNSHCISDDEASTLLLSNLEGQAQGTPKPLRFVTGRRKKAWVKNVVAVGLAAGFLEPLESTSIHLIMDGVGRLVQYFPDRDFHPSLAAEFNRKHAIQFESIRDFIVLHYHLTQRDDSELWRYCASMKLPDTLAHQIELFRGTGRVMVNDPESFLEPSWVSIYLGLGLKPERLDPFVEQVDEHALRTHFLRLRQAIAGTVAAMPDHAAYIERHVKAAPPVVPAV